MPNVSLADLAVSVRQQTSQIHFPTDSSPESISSFFVEPSLIDRTGKTIEPQVALNNTLALLIVGPPGGGKTTLLQFLANQQANQFLKDSNQRCPILIPARHLAVSFYRDDFFALVAPAISLRASNTDLVLLLESASKQGRLSIFLDGFDEVANTSERLTLQRAIQQARDRYPLIQWIVASRPFAVTGWPEGYSFFQIQAFTDDVIVSFLKRAAQSDPERADEFLAILRESNDLMELARNPLILSLLWRIFRVRGHLPSGRAFIYADISDFVLSTWDKFRGVHRSIPVNGTILLRSLEDIALYQFEEQKYTLTRVEALKLLEAALEDLRDDEVEETTYIGLLERLTESGILRETGLNQISFVHLSFLEFYTARALLRMQNPQALLEAIDKPSGHQVVIFASGMMRDVGPVVESALQKGLILLAATCISNGRLENEQLAEYVASELRREVGEKFFNLLINKSRNTGSADELDAELKLLPTKEERGKNKASGDSRSASPGDNASDPDLLTLWKAAQEKTLPAHEKGRRLETFTQAFFKQFFVIAQGNLNTEAGEIDILLENTNTSPFWMEFGAHVFVECKNWITHVPVHEIGHFGFKANQYQVRLAFFIALSGFTEDALRTMKNQAVSASGPLLIPIIKEDIERALEHKENLEEFLKERIREMKFQRKF